MRDSALLALFYGLVLDDAGLIARFREQVGWPEDESWGLYELGSRSAWSHVPVGVLLHRPSAVGQWRFDDGHARPPRQDRVTLSGLSLVAPPDGESIRPWLDELRTLGVSVHAAPGWQALALVDLKHS